ncbi:VTT domain-containing protein [Kitasatospora sp. MAP5-34]|uniref:TVP38/TMEM64 family protein n=1 Tax=Kitasatospora sp. MAP5-34 TaxID=3035102 RepID=UPI002473B6AC|nr:VTT domain-containing protein [Kitasatospora sp. MAP5-34]MDH6576846.1 putative membrane protein YdjX (TVP38/TMEM64 family) [Kitasatospora sp. MAP5-34]
MPDAPASTPTRPGRSPRLRLALLLLILAAAAGSLLLWDPTQLLAARTPGLWRAPVFLAVYALGTLAFVPKPALNAAAGLLLGVTVGLPLAVLGTTLGAALAFALGRSLGRDALRPLLKAKVLAALDRRLTEQGFRSVLLLRLIPGIPFQAANYGAAFSGVRTAPFLSATALGVLPGTAAYVVAGASAGTPGSPAFLLSAAVIAAMGVFSLVSLWRASQRSRAAA